MKVKILTKSWKWVLRHYFIFLLIGCIGFVGIVSIYKILIVKPTHIYVKVKMGQGLWWAATQKPSMWYVQAIKQAKEEKDLTGKPVVELQKVTYYPWYGGNQYDIYVIAKLRVSKIGNAGKYNFKRSTIGVGVPIDFEFNTVQFSGTIIEMSTKPIVERIVEKKVTLSKRGGYTKDSSYRYENIKVGSSYFNGQNTVFTILDKKLNQQIWTITNSLSGEVYERNIETDQNIVIHALIKGVERNGRFIFAEEQILSDGKYFTFTTDDFTLLDYEIVRVE